MHFFGVFCVEIRQVSMKWITVRRGNNDIGLG